MQTKQKIELGPATALAHKILEALSHGADRIQIAGSIRRKKPVIGDIEIVAIPHRQPDLFGNPAGASWLDPILDTLVSSGRLLRGDKNGELYKKLIVPATGTQVDLFLTTPEQWPVIFAIRTGSADFSHRLVTQRSKGGLLPSDCNVSGGFVWQNGKPLQFNSERDFLEFCGGWVEPEKRV